MILETKRAVFAVIFFLTFIFSSPLRAQVGLKIKWYSKDTRLDVGGSWGLPTSYQVEAFDTDLRLQRDISTRVAALFSVGYAHFFPGDIYIPNDFNVGAGFIPVKTGSKVFLTQSFYISGEVGTAIKTRDFSQSLLYSPGVGFEFRKSVDFGMRYETYTKYNVGRIAFKASYGFTLKRRAKYTSWYQ